MKKSSGTNDLAYIAATLYREKIKMFVQYVYLFLMISLFRDKRCSLYCCKIRQRKKKMFVQLVNFLNEKFLQGQTI
jgi:hypothetical protein